MSYRDDAGEFGRAAGELQRGLLRAAGELRAGKCDTGALRELLGDVERAAVDEREMVAAEKLRHAVEEIERVESKVESKVDLEVEVDEETTPEWQIEYSPVDGEWQAAEALQREIEIDRIVNSVAELKDVFHDLETLVVQQGELVEHIQGNLDGVHTHTRNAARQLYSADRWDRRRRRCSLVVVALAVILVLILFALVI